MRSLQQKLSKKVAFSFFDMNLGYVFNGPSLYDLSGNINSINTYLGGLRVDSIPISTDKVLLDEYGSGRLFGVVLPTINLPVAMGGDYALTVELDGAVYNLTNPTPEDFGRAYSLTRAAHFFNCPNVGNSKTPMVSADAMMAAGFGIEYKSKIKITCNYPTYMTGGYNTYEHAASVVYSKNEHYSTHFDFVEV